MAASVLGEFTGVLLDATRGALRLRVDGRSTARGSLPAWLSAAADFEVVGIESGSTLLIIEAPTVGECLSLVRQLRWGTAKAEALEGLLRELVIVPIDSRPVLERFGEFHSWTKIHRPDAQPQ